MRISDWSSDVCSSDLEHIVEYHEETRDVRPFLTAAHVFVLPSYYREGLPRTLLEALATGRPIITTDMPGCREPVREGLNGFLVPPRNAEKLAAAMERFLADPALAVERSEEHTSELQSLMRISYAVFCLKQ